MLQLPPDRRRVNFIFDPVGGSGKSLTALYIALNPKFDGLLAVQLASPDRWVSAFICQMEGYIALNGRSPRTIVVDMTRNQDNANVESFYSALENIKNGLVDSTFYGRFKRLYFKAPHVIVFTNNVPNMSALSSNRFNLFFLSDEEYFFTMVKCRVSLEISAANKSLVTWCYRAWVLNEGIQEKFYRKIFDGADMVDKAMSALKNKGGHITKKPFDGDKRTKSHSNAPEPVQELLIKYLE